MGWIVRGLRVKIGIVEQDPYEGGRRAVLNLGHTVGHGLERLSGYSLRHGEAVGIGMVAAARIAAELSWAGRSLAERIESLLAAWGLPVRCPPFDVTAIWEAMSHDKKQRGGTLRWVLPRAVGDVAITADVPPMVVRSVLRDLGARRET
jgi:3-dehydroquinate synthetase